MSSAYLSHAALDLSALVAQVTAAEHGAISTFLGIVRDHQDGRPVTRLEYASYQAMAEAECGRIVAETEQRWPVQVALCHRLGALAIGEIAVAIAVGSGHRGAAFEACRHVIEEVKRRVPIWKKEFYADGEVVWVDPSQLGAPVPEPR